MTKILSLALNPAIDISTDAVKVGHTHKTRTHNQRQFPGGGGINVARVIAELGGQSDLAYLSGGGSGILLESMLSTLAGQQHVFKIHDAVRIAFMVHEESTNFEYRFVPEGPLVTEAEVQPVFDLLETSDADYVVASGSLPRGLPADTYARMADIAARQGARFVIDTSGEALHETLTRSRVFLMKPSSGELESFAGRKLDTEGLIATASEIVASGAAQNVAVTLGADGAMLVNADGVIRTPAIDVPVQSAVGAGDSFVAGMVWSLAEGHEIAEAFRFGVATGAAAVMTSGTELCRRQDVMTLYEASRATSQSKG